MTSNDIESVQIIATTKDGQHLMGFADSQDNRFLIDVIVSLCKFVKLKNEIFAQCSLKELME